MAISIAFTVVVCVGGFFLFCNTKISIGFTALILSIIAITLGERLTSDTFVVHFEKAFSEIQGAYPMVNREFVRHELADYTYVNRASL